jgi:anti-sigma regulatory factor (Ser/Thr protein kinase)
MPADTETDHRPVAGKNARWPPSTKLCETLSASLIGDTRPISLKISVEVGSATSRQAVSVGLIVTELVINSLKHASPDDKRHGEIVICYKIVGTNWTLSVSDNGSGKVDGSSEAIEPGLGTSTIKALARQLDATIEVTGGPSGTTVSIAHAPFTTFSPVRPERQKPLGRFGKLQAERTVHSQTASPPPPLTSTSTAQSSDNRAEKFTDTGGEAHRQRAPECHSGCGAQNVCSACSCADRAQKSERAQRRGEHWGKRTGGRYDNHERGHARAD